MTNSMARCLGLKLEGRDVVVVVSSADKRGLPRFRFPKGNTLLPVCLVIDIRGAYNGVPARCRSRKVWWYEYCVYRLACP